VGIFGNLTRSPTGRILGLGLKVARRLGGNDRLRYDPYIIPRYATAWNPESVGLRRLPKYMNARSVEGRIEREALNRGAFLDSDGNPLSDGVMIRDNTWYENFVSTNIDAFKYDYDTGILTVRFVGGNEYEYDDVPADVPNEWARVAGSKGIWFNEHIKWNYHYRKI